VTVVTPHDGPLAEFGRRLLDTALIYGDDARKRRGEEMLAVARRLTGPAAADRAAFAAKSKRVSPYDLFDAVEGKRVELEEVPADHRPAAMKGRKTAGERRAHLDRVAEERRKLYAEALELEKKRAAAIAAELARRGAGKDAFDTQVLEILRRQARKFEIDY